MTLQHWLQIACRRNIVLRATKVAIIVGTLLVVINHGDALLGGEIDLNRALKMVLTYCVPYCVATWSAVATAIEQQT